MVPAVSLMFLAMVAPVPAKTQAVLWTKALVNPFIGSPSVFSYLATRSIPDVAGPSYWRSGKPVRTRGVERLSFRSLQTGHVHFYGITKLRLQVRQMPISNWK